MAEETVGLFTGIDPLANTVQLLKDFGFFQVVLPLLLVFAVLYGILTVTKIFGDNDKAVSINAIVAFSASFFVISSTEVVQMMNELLPQASFLLVISVFLVMLLSIFLGDPKKLIGEGSKWWAKGALILICIIFLGVVDASIDSIEVPVIHQINNALIADDGSSGSGSGGSGLPWYEDPAYTTLINALISIGLVIGFPIIVIWIMVRGTRH